MDVTRITTVHITLLIDMELVIRNKTDAIELCSMVAEAA